MKNKIICSVLLLSLLLTLCIVNIKPTYAISENDTISQEYTYILAQDKIDLWAKDISPLLSLRIRELVFNYRIRLLSSEITFNDVVYSPNDIVFELTSFKCVLDASYLFQNASYSESLFYSWGLGDYDTQVLNQTSPIIYTKLNYDTVQNGTIDLSNVNLKQYMPECFINLYHISQYNDLNGLTRYGIGVYFAFDLWNENGTRQQIQLRNNTDYELGDSRFLNVSRIQSPIDINLDVTFKDINYIYIDRLVKNATIKDYLDRHPGNNDLSNVDFSDWITTAISGFMEFEIVPGLSLSNILLFILSIGLVFLFLRFFSGG